MIRLSIRFQIISLVVLSVILSIIAIGVTLNGFTQINRSAENLLTLQKAQTSEQADLQALQKDLVESTQQILSATETTQNYFVTISLVTLIVLIGIGFGILATIKSSLKKTTQMTQGLVSGNLTSGFHDHPNNEIGEITLTVKKFVDHIRETLTEIGKKELQLSDAAVTLQNSFNDFSGNFHQALDGLTETESRTIQLSKELDENILSNEDISRSFHKIQSILEHTEANANKGISSNQEDQANLEQVNELVDSIATISKEITEMVTQTNTLALNAAIEAAKAGEHGKGFAVVAEEMAGIAANIKNLAVEIQTLAHNTTLAVESTKHAIQETGRFLGRIMEQSTEGVSKIVGLQEITEKVADSIKAIRENLYDLQKKCGYNTSYMSQVEASATNHMETSAELLEYTQFLKDIVKQFDMGISYKKVKPSTLDSRHSHSHSHKLPINPEESESLLEDNEESEAPATPPLQESAASA